MFDFWLAEPNEAQFLSELALRSKAHWGYSLEFMEACKSELSHTPEQLQNDKYIYNVIIKGGIIIGFYKLENILQETVILEALFLEPSEISFGFGRKIFEHAKSVAAEQGGRFIEVQSDPYAEDFYKSVGMKVIGKTESGSIIGRYLPILIASLSPENASGT